MSRQMMQIAREHKPELILTAIFGAVLLFLAAICGCSTSATNTAYKAEGATITTVDTAMKAWGDYVASGQASQQQMDAVRQGYAAYYNTQMTAKAALEAYLATQSQDTSNSLAQVTVASSEAAGSLVALVQQFIKPTTKGKP